MENAAAALKPKPPRGGKCGEEQKFIGAILDSAKGRTIRLYECRCGERTWTSRKTYGGALRLPSRPSPSRRQVPDRHDLP
jgi:hypothetical protein